MPRTAYSPWLITAARKLAMGIVLFRMTVRAGENALDLLPCSQANLSLVKFIMRVSIPGSAQALSIPGDTGYKD